MKDLCEKIFNNTKDILVDVCFGLLILLNWNAFCSSIRKLSAILDNGMVKIIDINSPNWCEQSQYKMITCTQQDIYAFMFSAIIASLLYNKYKKLAFLCLIFAPLIYFYIVPILIER